MPLPECFHCKYGEAGFPCRRADGSFDFEKTGAAIVAIGRTFADDFEGDAEAVREELIWASDCEYEINQDHPDMLLGLTAGAMMPAKPRAMRPLSPLVRSKMRS